MSSWKPGRQVFPSYRIETEVFARYCREAVSRRGARGPISFSGMITLEGGNLVRRFSKQLRRDQGLLHRCLCFCDTAVRQCHTEVQKTQSVFSVQLYWRVETLSRGFPSTCRQTRVFCITSSVCLRYCREAVSHRGAKDPIGLFSTITPEGGNLVKRFPQVNSRETKVSA